MTEEQVLNSDNLKKRFIRDVKVPLGITRNPYFLYRVKTFQESKLFPDVYDRWVRFVDTLKEYDNEQDYFEHYNEVKDGIIDTIKGSEAYDRFNNEDMNRFAVPIDLRSLPSSNIFKPSNHGKRFLSIDMKKANFSALHYYDPVIFDGCDTWEEFVGEFTTHEHIKSSKYIREATMGNCNPKRHIAYTKYLMSKFLNLLLSYDDSYECQWYNSVVSFCNDEIVFDVTDFPDHDLASFKKFIKEIYDGYSVPFHVNTFTLYHIEPIGGYIEKHESGELVIKALDGNLIPLLVAKVLNKELQEEDLVFIHPNLGVLSKIIEVPEIVLPEGIL